MSGKSLAQQAEEAENFPAPIRDDVRNIRYSTAINRRVTDYCLLGCSNAELAPLLGVDETTIDLWLVEQPSFRRAVDRGRKEADSKVARSLYKRAVGMSVPETKVFNVAGKLQTVDIKRYYPPSETAGALWLANREPGKWKSKEANSKGGPDLAALVEESLRRVNQAKAAQPGDDAKIINADQLDEPEPTSSGVR